MFLAFTAARDFDVDSSHAKYLEWYPLYSNRGFILHVNPRNLGFGRSTWFRGFKRKWVNAWLLLTIRCTWCVTHMCWFQKKKITSLKRQIKHFSAFAVGTWRLILQRLHHLYITVHHVLTTTKRDSTWSRTMMQGKHLNPTHNQIDLLNATALPTQQLFFRITFPEELCTIRLLPSHCDSKLPAKFQTWN